MLSDLLQFFSQPAHIVRIVPVIAWLDRTDTRFHRSKVENKRNNDQHLRRKIAFEICGREIAPECCHPKQHREKGCDALDDTLARLVEKIELLALHFVKEGNKLLAFF